MVVNKVGQQVTRVRRRLLTVLLAGGLCAGLSVSGAGSAAAAVPAVTAVCSASIPLNLSPGLQLLKKTQGTNQSFGETGSLSCIGTLDGYPIAGPGTMGFSGNYAGTCSSASGVGTWSFSVPVSDNGVTRLIRHSGTYTAPNVTLAIVFNGTFETGQLTGAGVVVAQQGNCFLSPMTRAVLPLVSVNLTQ